MPHSEYPSGSACVCEALAEYFKTYYGFDNVFEPNGPQIPLSLQFPAFSSTKEPQTTPGEDVTLQFFSWSEISERCGESRLNGGMHFTEMF